MNYLTTLNKKISLKDTEYKVKSLVKTKNEINELNEMLEKATALIAFEIGKRLQAVKEREQHGDFIKWLNKNITFSIRTAYNYMALYNYFKFAPVANLDDMKINEALIIAGIKKPKEKAITKDLVEYGNPDKQLEFDWESCFAKPTLSKAKLNNYRFECSDDRSFWLVKRGFNVPIKFLDLYIEPETRDELIFHYEGMLKTIQSAVENYFLEVEQVEEREGL